MGSSPLSLLLSLSVSRQLCSITPFCYDFLSHHRPKSNGSEWPCTDPVETKSQNKLFSFKLFFFFQVFCHSNEKLTNLLLITRKTLPISYIWWENLNSNSDLLANIPLFGTGSNMASLVEETFCYIHCIKFQAHVWWGKKMYRYFEGNGSWILLRASSSKLHRAYHDRVFHPCLVHAHLLKISQMKP